MKKTLFTVGILALAATAFAVDFAVTKFYPSESMTVPISALSAWTTARGAGDPDAADASPVVNGGTLYTSIAPGEVFDMTERGGTGVVVRFVYQGSVSTSPVIRLFGRYDSTDSWQILTNRAGDDTATLTVDTTNDSTDGTNKFTTVVLDDHYFDAQGCRYIMVGIQTAQSGGTSSVSYIQMKSF